MPTTDADKLTGGRLSGERMRMYMESFAERFLKGKIRYNTTVTNVRRRLEGEEGKRWVVTVHDTTTGEESQLRYDKIVLCTGVSTQSPLLEKKRQRGTTLMWLTGVP